jgi:hypothetical protein
MPERPEDSRSKGKVPWPAMVHAFCGQYGLALPEFFVFESVAECAAMKRSFLLGYAARGLEHFPNAACHDWGYLLQHDWSGSLESLLEKGILRDADGDFLRFIRDYLKEHPAIGPIDPLPELGQIDLTLEGASLWAAFENEFCGYGNDPPRPCAWRWDRTPTRLDIYGTTRNWALRFLRDCENFKEVCVIRAGRPTPVGAFHGRWWRSYQSGWRIIVYHRTPRTHTRWPTRFRC